MSALKVDWRFWDPTPEDKVSTLDHMLHIANEMAGECTCKTHRLPPFQGRLWVVREGDLFPMIWMLDFDRLVGVDLLDQPVFRFEDKLWRPRRIGKWVSVGCQCTASAQCQEKMMGLFLPITRKIKRSELSERLRFGLRHTDDWRRAARVKINESVSYFRRHPNDR